MHKQVTPKFILFQLAFWSLVFLLNVGPNWQKFGSLREVIEVAGSITLLQGAVALIAIFYLVPVWLDTGRVKRFAALMFGLLFCVAELSVYFSYSYLEPTYPETYGKFYQGLVQQSLLERLGFSINIRYILFSKLPLFFFPAAVLIAVSYYQQQQTLLALREQKRAAELDALKNQLNPHFVFNTLNNIYALAIKRSEQTPEAIEKLSGILDYVLYRCNEPFVTLRNEVEMIHNYIALEQLRFAERLEVTFDCDVDQTLKVAPLLFLTLIENAFKHGASQELNKAKIELRLTATDDQIEFAVSNSKPTSSVERKAGGCIGLANLRRQLALLYPNAYALTINEDQNRYTACMTLPHVS